MQRPGFVERILTLAERDYCRTPQQVAGRWAAKEAIMKAGGPQTFLEIEVLPGPHGEPRVVRPGGRWHLSITHERGTAAAVAILEEGPAS